MSGQKASPKIGAGHAAALARSGLKEISRILPAFPTSIQPVEEPGLWGNPVPQEVFEQKQVQPQMDEPEMEMGM